MISRILPLFLVLVGFELSAQQPGCDGERFRYPVFSQIDSTINVYYGSNFSRTGIPVDLYMDVYEPGNDTMTSRPTVVLAFGGSYVSGTRKQMRQMCLYLASLGYVAATIDYRINYNIFVPIDTIGLFDVVVKSVGDMKAAIRHLRQSVDSGNVYGINPDWIVVGGASSGAITSMVTAFVTDTTLVPHYIQELLDSNGGMEGNTTSNYQYSSAVNGVLNYSGAIRDTNWIADDNNTPVFSVHEDQDAIVPYGRATVTPGPGLTVELCGSKCINEKLDANGVFNELITFEDDGGHVGYFMDTTKADYKLVLDQTASFLNTLYCPDFNDTLFQDTTTGISNRSLASLSLFPNPTNEAIQIQRASNEAMNYVVFDAFGRQLNSGLALENPFRFETQQLPDGLYFIRLEREGKSVVKRFIVQH